jgi:hypothetical protein
MLSFNETLVSGIGGGADWLQEHIRTGYLPAWSNPVPITSTDPKAVPNPDPLEGVFLQDAGMRVKALSRWNNYYVAGLRQIMRDYGADGIYLDEIAYDRTTMLRARKVLGDRGRIDHHADHGFVSQSPVINYMELYLLRQQTQIHNQQSGCTFVKIGSNPVHSFLLIAMWQVPLH